MIFTNAGFIVFLTIIALAYYILPHKMQNFVIVLSSVIFYLFNTPPLSSGNILQSIIAPLTLLLNVIFTFFIAHAIEKSNGKKRKILAATAVISLVAVLCLFKYSGAFAPMLLLLSGGALASLALPLGISFYTFASLGYIFDVTNGDIKAEKNIINYAAFVTFFGTIISGPICRAGKILPQLSKKREFSAQKTCDAFRLMLFGFFKWIAIANVLGLFVNEVFISGETFNSYSGSTLILTAFLWALQLYFEFSGYSDIARGVALILGIDIPINFKTPYFSTNFSGFWSAWHISLSSWLQDYVFTPLVWSRWPSKIPVIGEKYFEKPPIISSVAIVFVLSGIWHGDTMPFFVWGVLQAVFRVGEELLHRYYKKPQKKPKPPLRIFKTTSVFILWSISLVFFRVGLMKDGTVGDAFNYITRFFTNLNPSQFLSEASNIVLTGFYSRDLMIAFYVAYLLFVLLIAFYFDWQSNFKQKSAHISLFIAKQRPSIKWSVYYMLIILTLVGFIMQSGGFGTVSFAYAQF